MLTALKMMAAMYNMSLPSFERSFV